jgi:hypothetical protein
LQHRLEELLGFAVDEQRAAHHRPLARLQAFQHPHAAAALVADLDLARDELPARPRRTRCALPPSLSSTAVTGSHSSPSLAGREHRHPHQQPRAQLGGRLLELDVEGRAPRLGSLRGAIPARRPAA